MTAETTGEASPGEASFQLLAEHLPDLIIFAFDADLRMWAATGGGLRARGWTSEDFIGMTVPEIAGATRAEDIRARCEAALAGQRTQLEMAGYDPRTGCGRSTSCPSTAAGPRGGMVLCHDVTVQRRADAERRRLLNRAYEAQEGQDRRLAADLHDGHVQSLAAIGFKLEQARLRLGASGSPEADELLWQVTKHLSAEVTSLRRTIGRLRPLVLVEDGLETALFRVAQQALANVVDHAGPTHTLLAIECSATGATLRVSDDGCAFDPDHVQVLADIAHFGLIAMRERVEALGGRFRVLTTPAKGRWSRPTCH